MSTNRKASKRSGVILAPVFFASALFVALALTTSVVGPVGAFVETILHGLLGPLAWAVPVEFALVGVMVMRRSRAVVLGLTVGDMVITLALAVVFQSGAFGEMIGGLARDAVSTVGTVLAAMAVIGIIAVSRTSLMFGVIVQGARAAWAHWETARDAEAVQLVSPPKVVVKPIACPEPVLAPASVAAPVVAAAPAAAPTIVTPAPVVASAPRGPFALPSLGFLAASQQEEAQASNDGELLVSTLGSYGIQAKVERTLTGPTVTTFEVSVAAGTKLSRVVKLETDLSLALGRKLRVVPSRAGLVGFEVPNEHRVAVNLRELIESNEFQTMADPLPIVLGRDMQGAAVFADLASMPHVIVAGASGSGKSVGLNVMLASLLCRRTPEELRFIMIDPKVVELAPYAQIPHMLLPVVTDMKQAAAALEWAVTEMERRYQLFAAAGAKNITSFNAKASKADRMPFIVIVVDEFADLIMQQGKAVEAAVARLGQKARAAGMHMILATQRPSVDVITGTIKANFSSRIAYRVAQAVDSRTILDEQGAESLLGSGDMLVKLNGASESRRVQCPMISEDEIAALAGLLGASGQTHYDASILVERAEAPARKVRVSSSNSQAVMV